MPTKWTHREAFKYFGTTPTNVRWSWSAQSPDGKTVVVTLWQNEFKKTDGKLVYAVSLTSDNRPGARELRQHLKWAADNCDGRIRVIVAIPKDPTANSRSIKECFPSKIVMRLTQLNPETGAFAAETELPELRRAA